MVLAVPIGYLSVRRTGIYFAMVTLAFAQMIYFVANQWRDVTGGENGLQGIPKTFFGIDLVETDAFYFYYAALPLILVGCAHRLADRALARSAGCWWRSATTRPGRAPSATTWSATSSWRSSCRPGSPGLAGGVFAISHGFASLQELNWTTSGKVVLITVLGGIGTLWGGPLGAALVVLLEDQLASSGFNGIGIITGAIFVVIVLLFRHGIWGTARNGVNAWLHKRRVKSGQSM